MAADLWWLGVAIPSAVVAIIALSYIVTKLTAPGFKVDGKHVFITGGSTGLGLALGKKYAAAGAKVSIVARGVANLEAAKAEIEAVSKHKTPVFFQSCDVTEFESVQDAVNAANKFHGHATDHLICSAGVSHPGYFLDTDVSVFHKMMDLNYFGTLHAIKAALPAMISQEAGGQIVLVSSGLALTSWIGYSQYSGSKYATRGLADSLRNELLAYNIRVSIYYPGNIDSPGFVEEEKTKPEETKTIEGITELTHPDAVAQSLINGISDGEFSITNEVMIFFLRTIANGVAPRYNSMLEMVLLPIIVPVQIGFGFFMDFTVKQAAKKKANKNKKE
jgi:NAD(P)-dependent dehydrogenase (short-subunit alcohol dehydrogenase family)